MEVLSGVTFKKFFLPFLIGLLLLFILLLIRSFILEIFHRWAKKTHTDIDNLIIKTIRIPSLFWCLALGLYFGIIFSELPEKVVFYINKIIYILLILSITQATGNMVSNLLANYITKKELPIPPTGIFYAITKGTIFVIGLLIALSTLGVAITPLLTALGVGGLAVALALKDTLANLFAGIHILLEKSIRVGDFIKLETGEEGYVVDITWRTTRIKTLPNNMVIIPNSRLAQSVVTNYHLPEKKMALRIPISVSYSSDPALVEKIILEETKRAVGEVPGLLAEPEPIVRFIPGFGESSLDFTLVCHVQEFTDQYLIQHELRKRIYKKFKEEKIEIPFPHRVIYLRREDKEN